MKKLVVFALSAVMCLSIGMTAFAKESTEKKTEAVLTVDGEEEATELVTENLDKYIVEDIVSTENGWAVADLSTKWLVPVYNKDVSLPEGTEMPEEGIDITFTLPGGELEGQTEKTVHIFHAMEEEIENGYAFHYEGYYWEIIPVVELTNEAVTGHFTSLSPVIITVEGERVVKTKLFDELEKLMSDPDRYTTNSWNELKAFCDKALAEIIDNPDATKDDVDAMMAELAKVEAGLVEAADKADLRSEVNAVSGAKKENYTAESWKAFEAAFDEAKTVLNDGNATQDMVNAANKKLADAYAALKKDESEGNPGGGSGETTPPTTPPSGPAPTTSPKTADANMALMFGLAVMFCVAAFAAGVQVKKSR